MNERIKLLAAQANIGLIHGNFLTGPQEKFAELIIKECINVIRADYVDLGTTAAVNNIEKHFGVDQ